VITAPLGTRLSRTRRVVSDLALTWATARLATRLSRARRRALARACARRTLAALEVPVTLRGHPPVRRGACLVVANHVSWLDVYALNTVHEARFVAKSEVAAWPIAGGIASGFDAIFIERARLRDARRVKDEVARALRAGERVVVFPEGTTTDGSLLLPFRPALFQAAIDAAAFVQPVAIRYPNCDGTPNPHAAFVGDTSFVTSLRRVLRLPALRAELTFGPALEVRGRTRGEIAAWAQAFVARAIGVRSDPPGTSRRPPRRLGRLAG
jgi:1-acyl-sn-glycerol-3-phosphate acyltransferase